jgi:hypothetical protein
MPRNRLPRVTKHYSPAGRSNHDRPLKRLLDAWERNGSTSGPTPWQIYDDDDICVVLRITLPKTLRTIPLLLRKGTATMKYLWCQRWTLTTARHTSQNHEGVQLVTCNAATLKYAFF